MTVVPEISFKRGNYDFDPTYGYTFEQLCAVETPPGPDDFLEFWSRRYQQILLRTPDPELSNCRWRKDGWQVYDISYQSTDGFQINGWLLLPESGKINRGFVVGHGYGGRDGPDFHLPFKDCAILFPCFRGLSLSQKDPVSTDPQWHVLHDIDKTDRYILGGCVDDLWLAVSSLLILYPHLSGKMAYLGISFGGGIGSLALSVEQRVAQAHLNVPTFGNQPLRLQLKTLGSGNSVQQYFQQHQEKTLQVLQYYDAAIAARYINIPIHCACALYDPFVAPPGQFAIYNALPGPKQLFVYAAGHHAYAGLRQQENDLLAELDEFFKPLL